LWLRGGRDCGHPRRLPSGLR